MFSKKTVWSILLFSFSRKTFALCTMIPPLTPYIPTSLLSVSSGLAEWKLFDWCSAAFTIWAVAHPAALRHWDPWKLGKTFPSRLSGFVSVSADWTSPSDSYCSRQQVFLILLSALSKIRLLQRAVSSCVDVFTLHFSPLGLFFLSPISSEFLLFEITEVQMGDNFSTHIPFLQC